MVFEEVSRVRTAPGVETVTLSDPDPLRLGQPAQVTYGGDRPTQTPRQRAQARYQELYTHLKSQGYSDVWATKYAGAAYREIDPSGTAPSGPATPTVKAIPKVTMAPAPSAAAQRAQAIPTGRALSTSVALYQQQLKTYERAAASYESLRAKVESGTATPAEVKRAADTYTRLQTSYESLQAKKSGIEAQQASSAAGAQLRIQTTPSFGAYKSFRLGQMESEKQRVLAESVSVERSKRTLKESVAASAILGTAMLGPAGTMPSAAYGALLGAGEVGGRLVAAGIIEPLFPSKPSVSLAIGRPGKFTVSPPTIGKLSKLETQFFREMPGDLTPKVGDYRVITPAEKFRLKSTIGAGAGVAAAYVTGPTALSKAATSLAKARVAGEKVVIDIRTERAITKLKAKQLEVAPKPGFMEFETRPSKIFTGDTAKVTQKTLTPRLQVYQDPKSGEWVAKTFYPDLGERGAITLGRTVRITPQVQQLEFRATVPKFDTNIFSPRISPMQDFIGIPVFRSISKQDEKQLAATVFRTVTPTQVTKVFAPTKPKIITTPKQLPFVEELPSVEPSRTVVPRTTTFPTTVPKMAVSAITVAPTIPKPPLPTKPEFIEPQVYPRKRIPLTDYKFRKEKKKKKKGKVGKFDVFVKMRGEFKLIGQPKSLRQAISKGVQVTAETPARSFKVLPAGAPRGAKGIALPPTPGYYFKKGTAVEKTKYAINTAGELAGITMKGVQASQEKIRRIKIA